MISDGVIEENPET
ncbi:hypothetical protein CP8484711_0636A, partial [Chlamydia psittaci 84-8471/1]